MNFIQDSEVYYEEEWGAAPRMIIEKNRRYNRSHRSTRGYEFIAWDGEGTAVNEPITLGHGICHWEDSRDVFLDYTPQAQPYVLLGNSKTGHIKDENGLSSKLIFDTILDVKEQYPESVFIGFSINYDINQWLKDIPTFYLWHLYARTRANFAGYSIRWLPRKMFYIRKGDRSATIYDTFGFFQSSFLMAARKYLPPDHPDLALIEKGKAQRTVFNWDEMDDFIIPYNEAELRMLVEMMDLLRADFDGIDIFPGQWHGPGAVANQVLKKWNVPISREVPEGVLNASQYAYAGGRFEHFYVGRYTNTVYEYDIHSAYPAAATHLPNLQAGSWEHVNAFEPGSFGVWHIEYQSPDGPTSNKPQPLFCRADDGRVSYPREVQGWYWTPEASLCPDAIREGWVFRPGGRERPFSFIEEMYERRRVLKVQGSSTERALKLILNSIYGKLAQVVGGRYGPPAWHQLEYAGYITSFTRAKIYEAVRKNPDSIISLETDAVFSKEPLDLPVSEALGDWEEKTYEGIVYLQSGFYYAGPEGHVCRFRGMDRSRKGTEPEGLPFGFVLDHLRQHTGIRLAKGGPTDGQPIPYTTPLRGYTTRFIGLGFGLKTDSIWRSWEKRPRLISLDNDSWSNKRYHLIAECSECQAGKTMYDSFHPMLLGGHEGHSYAKRIPWRESPDDAPDCDRYGDYLKMEEMDLYS